MGVSAPLNRHIGGLNGGSIGLCRFGNPPRQRGEFHRLQEGNEFRAVLRFQHQCFKRLIQRHVGPQGHELSGNTSKFRIGDDIFPTLLLLDLTCPGEQRIEIAVFFQQLRGRLWTDAGDARNIVGRIAGHGLQVDHLFGTHAPFLYDIRDADLLVLHRIVHVDIGSDELHQILVGGDDGDIGPNGLRLPGIGGDDIVRLEAFRLDAGKVEGARRLPYQPELRHQIFRRRRAIGFIEIIKLIAECL